MEKELIQSIRKMKEEVENAKAEGGTEGTEGRSGPGGGDSGTACLTELEKKIKEASAKLAEVQKDRKMLKEEVDAEDIAEIVARWTGIPVTRMLESDRAETASSRGPAPPAGDRAG